MAKRRQRPGVRRHGGRRACVRSNVFIIEAFFGLAVLVLLAFASYRYVINTPYLLVKTLRIEGANRLNEEDIRRTAGITDADNMLFLRTAPVQERIAAMPYVKKCSVQRAFPDVVVIKIEERAPAATLLANNRLLEIDCEGVVLSELDKHTADNGPFITNVAGLDYVEVGDHLEQPALLNALAVWRAFSAVPVSREVNVSEIAAFGPNEILMYCDNLDYEIRWGRSDFEGQARRLDVFWRAKRDKLALNEYIDLRFDDKVVCR